MNILWLTIAIALAQATNGYLGWRTRMDGVPTGRKKLIYEVVFLIALCGTLVCAVTIAVQIKRAPDAIANKVGEQTAQPQPSQALQPSSSFVDDVADRILKRLKANRSTNLPQPTQAPTIPTPSNDSLIQAQSPQPQPVTSDPVITSAPPIFTGGTIRGEHFGSTGELHVRFQLKQSARTGVYENHWRNLLGNLDPANEPEMHPPSLVNWTDTAIEIRPTAEYKQQLLSDIENKARERNFPIPKEADLEIGYEVKTGDVASQWFFPKLQN